MLFGVWHAYAHCVRKTHEVFRSLWTALEEPQLMRGHPVKAYGYPQLFTLECMVTGLFLAQQDVGGEVQRALSQMQHDHGRQHHATTMVQNLHMLLNEYIPALMWLGMYVRQMSWTMFRIPLSFVKLPSQSVLTFTFLSAQ